MGASCRQRAATAARCSAEKSQIKDAGPSIAPPEADHMFLSYSGLPPANHVRFLDPFPLSPGRWSLGVCLVLLSFDAVDLGHGMRQDPHSLHLITPSRHLAHLSPHYLF
jgi:hypothetical protein